MFFTQISFHSFYPSYPGSQHFCDPAHLLRRGVYKRLCTALQTHKYMQLIRVGTRLAVIKELFTSFFLMATGRDLGGTASVPPIF